MTWGEREYELPWVLSRIRQGNVLDIGSAESSYIRDLLDRGHLVTLNDVRHFDFRHPAVKCHVGDIRQTTPEELGTFDNVLCISTLEHMALDAYDQKANWKVSPAETQLEAFKYIMSFVSSGGQMILTVPYGIYQHGGWVIVYDDKMIRDIKETCTVVEETYFTLTDRDHNKYVICRPEDCPKKGMDSYPDKGMRAWSVACLVLQNNRQIK